MLSEIGKKLADRWISLLALPGALYLAVAITARTLGHMHPWDVGRLTRQITAWANAPAVSSVGGQVVLVAAMLAVASAAGLAAQYCGSITERMVLAVGWRTWPHPIRQLAQWQVDRRLHRWREASAAYEKVREHAGKALARGHRLDPTARHAAYRAVMRVGAEEPDRPTWSGDRIHAAAVRLDRHDHVDLATVWPYLWLTVPEPIRGEVTTARAALTRATTLGGWAMLYALLTFWWWPALLLAAILAITARHRIRAAAETYAVLLEAITRLHSGELARCLGIDHVGPLALNVGNALDHVLRSYPNEPNRDG